MNFARLFSHSAHGMMGMLLLLIGLLTAAVLYLNSGSFVYVLDDPYIHLALADQIAQANYGLNDGEFASPASSILWPFLLAPFSSMRIMEYVPFAINVAALLATALVIRRSLHCVYPGHAGLLTFMLLFFLGAITLVFTGMEHSLQLLFAVFIVSSMIDLVEGRPVSRLLFIALTIAPFIRYELTGLAFGAIGLLCLQKKWRYSLAVVLVISGFAAFSYYIWRNSGFLLPASVMAKLGEDNRLVGMVALWACLLLLLFQLYRFRTSRKLFHITLYVAVAVLGHMLVGRTGWYMRYEVYILISAGLFLVYYARQSGLVPFFTEQKKRVVPVTAVACLSGFYMLYLIGVPGASHSIFAQQVQMQRFVKQAGLSAVAVNDIGYITYKSGNAYVHDLWGLGHYPTARMRMENSVALFDGVDEKNIPLVMVYRDLFMQPVPEHWQKIGVLELKRFPGFLVSAVAGYEVVFYAVSPEAGKHLRNAASLWKKGLPKAAVWKESR